METRYGTVDITTIAPQAASHLISESTALYRELYPENSNHFVFEEELSAEGAVFLGALLGERVIGCVGLVPSGEEEAAEIKRLFVAPDYRAGGIGSALMDALEQNAHTRGVRVMQLETGSADAAAHALYEKRGYVVVEPFGDYEEDPFSVFYRKDLGA